MASSGRPGVLRSALGCVVLALVALGGLTTAATAAEPADCSPVVARVVSLQGTIEVRRAGQQRWDKVQRLNASLCSGDLIHTGASSRAALAIPPEKFIRLDQNSTVSIHVSADETVVEFFQDQPKDSCGAGYFVTRFPRKFGVKTPYLNASVEGTEFLVSMSCSTAAISVFEGTVSAWSALASAPPLLLNKGETVSADATSEPPAVKLLVKPTDAVQWALYYPPLSEAGPDAGADQACEQSGDAQSRCLTVRAGERLRVGRVQEAQSDVDAALAIAPQNSDAEALLAIIAVVKNDKSSALSLARRATELDPDSPRAWIALSYAQQASFKLDDALASAERAAELAPHSATAQTRVAELLLSQGRIGSAERAAEAAVRADANHSRARTILGFVHLAQIETQKARADFEDAIARDSIDPLPRLGLGLAIIRGGETSLGREQIEIAVMLDPTQSLLRSYAGKAYYEENTKARDGLAATQLNLATELDPNDPTPWFYGSILRETENRPVEALENLQTSIALNDNRAVYRSSLLLDQDRAARTANLARIYQDLGFDQLAMGDAAKSLVTDPNSYSSHRFLADAYQTTPRATLSRESEYLQAQMNAPVGMVPVSPFNSLSNPFPSFLPAASVSLPVAPLQAAFNDFSSLFERNGAAVFADGLVATQSTVYDQLVVSGVMNTLGVSVGQGHFETAGYGNSQSLRQDAYSALIQVRAADPLQLQFEVNSNSSKRDALVAGFDPVNAQPYNIEESSSGIRVGGRYELGPGSNVLVSAANQTFEQDFLRTDLGFAGQFRGDANTVEAQYSLQRERFGLLAGFNHFDGQQLFVGTPLPDSASYQNGYLYGRLSDPGRVATLQLGVSVDTMENFDIRRERTCPKVGFMLTPVPGTTIRSAFACTAKRQLIANETLEPTQLAGFNQFFDDPVGSVAWLSGLGLDQRLGKNLFVGFEVVTRDIEVPLFAPPDVSDFTWHEDTARAYLYWAIAPAKDSGPLRGWSFALKAEYWYEDLQRPDVITGTQAILNLRTQYVPLAWNLFSARGFSAQLRTTYVDQKGVLQVDPFSDQFPVSDRFWLADVSLSYRLPRRMGRVSLGVSNVFDRRFNYVQSDPTIMLFAPERVVFGKITATF